MLPLPIAMTTDNTRNSGGSSPEFRKYDSDFDASLSHVIGAPHLQVPHVNVFSNVYLN